MGCFQHYLMGNLTRGKIIFSSMAARLVCRQFLIICCSSGRCLIGLPAFALVLVLLRNMDDKKRILLAGVVTGLVFEFHNVAFFCCYVAYVVT